MAFLSGSDVYFADLNRTHQIERRRIECFSEALDAPVDHLVRDIDLQVQLAQAGVEPEERVDREQPLSERNLRVSKDRAGLVVERVVAIPLQRYR